MKDKLITALLLCVSLCLCAQAFTRAPEVKIRQVNKLNLDWKCYKGTPVGNAYDNNYSDNSWQDANIPHSLDYPEPTQLGEQNSYAGIAWYRKKLEVSGGANKKYFLEFEGAMQTANVWVNGQSVGTHDNSGYTGFSFDITSQMGASTSAALAIKLDNRMSEDIPPGRTNPGPDYFLYSGLYRNVWLVTTGLVYIPFCGQLITTPIVSASSGTVRIKTTVKNENGSSKNCTVAISIRNKSGVEVAAGTSTAAVSAGGSSVFDMSINVTNPSLWSPEKPEFYRTYTTVSADGSMSDDYASSFGFRTLAWSSVNGFSLNGSRYHIEGTCQHQAFAWILNAVPDSRWPVEINQIKAAGFNSMRLSHYPRSPSFYYAADSLGMLLMVEPPTWGFGKSTYSEAYWTRLGNCAREMIAQAYNHPSVFLWGLFNEPGGSFADRLMTINNLVHSLDSTRATVIAQNVNMGTAASADIVGLNYQTIATFGNTGTTSPKYVTTEYFEGWNYYCIRGSATEPGWSDQGWAAYQKANNQPQQHAGQYLWVYDDYWAPYNPNKPMGIVDQYRLPKMLYYRFREAFTNTPPDYAVSGTPTKIDITTDLAKLQADGSDVAIVQAALRNSGNACINSTANVTFAVSGPATAFGPLTKAAAGGKTAIIIRATRADGTITVTANSSGLPQAQVSIISERTPIVVAIKSGKPALQRVDKHFTIGIFGNTISAGAIDAPADRILAFDIHGRIAHVWSNTSRVDIGGGRLTHGIFVVKAEREKVAAFRKLPSLDE
jgi:hypothetical protein